MCVRFFRIIYMLFIRQEGQGSDFLERCIGYVAGDIIFSDDDLRNESFMYGELFSSKCSGYIFDLFKRSMAEMKGLGYEESKDILDGLDFIQRVGATALWKFNFSLSQDMERFVRDFDRLDVADERKRLYLLAQI